MREEGLVPAILVLSLGFTIILSASLVVLNLHSRNLQEWAAVSSLVADRAAERLRVSHRTVEGGTEVTVWNLGAVPTVVIMVVREAGYALQGVRIEPVCVPPLENAKIFVNETWENVGVLTHRGNLFI